MSEHKPVWVYDHKPDTEYFWIYDHRAKKLCRIRTDDPGVDWSYAPRAGLVKVYLARVGSYSYYNYGTTTQEACDRANASKQAKIANLEVAIARLRKELVTP